MNSKFSCLLAVSGSLMVLAAAQAQSTLSFQFADGVPLIYDSAQNVTWTQDGNLAGQTFDFADAQTWAANLSLAGVGAGGWQLPDSDQFTSVYSQLPGVDHRYGAQVFFGPGVSDYFSNVQPEYWTDADSTDFNFYYGYPGDQADSNLYAVWAVTPGYVPEPSAFALGLLAGGLALGKGRLSRK